MGDGIARLIGIDYADVRAEAALAGANRAADERRRELREFASANLDEVVAALVPRAQEVGAQMSAALAAVDLADREWRGGARELGAVQRDAGREGELGALPPSPAAGLAHDRTALVPLPAGLLAGLQEVTL